MLRICKCQSFKYLQLYYLVRYIIMVKCRKGYIEYNCILLVDVANFKIAWLEVYFQASFTTID